MVLAYATTIHKSQGSEYPAVVIPLTTQHYPMLQRNLVYTGVTRGKRLVVLVGQRKALAIAVKERRRGGDGRSCGSGLPAVTVYRAVWLPEGFDAQERENGHMQIHLDRNRDKDSSIEVRTGPSLGAPGSNVHDLVASQSSALRLDCALGVVPRSDAENGWGREGGSD